MWYAGVMVMGKRAARRRGTDLAAYSGQWVALMGNRVVAHAPSLPAVLAQARRAKRGAKPSFFLVPRKDEGPYVLPVR